MRAAGQDWVLGVWVRVDLCPGLGAASLRYGLAERPSAAVDDAGPRVLSALAVAVPQRT